MRNKQKNIIKIFSFIFLVVFLITCGMLFYKYYQQRVRIDVSEYMYSQAVNNVIHYEGNSYKYNKNIKNILVLGREGDLENEVSERERRLSDILLVSIDEGDKCIFMLQIDTNTVTEIDLYNDSGTYSSSMEAQIAKQYTYGSDKKSSCQAMKKTVSKLLENLPIYGYVALDVETISMVTGILGGEETVLENKLEFFKSKVLPHLETDLNLLEMTDMANKMKEGWELGQLNRLPGKNSEDEFYVDKESLKASIIQLYYEVK